MAGTINLLTGATSSAAPTVTNGALGTAIGGTCDQGVVCVQNTAGTGTVTAVVIIWAWEPVLSRWFSLGALNGGAAIGETSLADTISFAQGIAGLRRFSRLYAELGTLGGAATAITVDVSLVGAESVTSS
jgi:hypothetical protein